MLLANGRANPSVTILGLTFKEDVPDIRNSKVFDIIHAFKSFGISVQTHDPMAEPAEVEHEFHIKPSQFDQLKPADAVILAVPHASYLKEGWPMIQKLLKPGSTIVLDVKAALPPATKPTDLICWSL